jgi:hypothetical protein
MMVMIAEGFETILSHGISGGGIIGSRIRRQPSTCCHCHVQYPGSLLVRLSLIALQEKSPFFTAAG